MRGFITSPIGFWLSIMIDNYKAQTVLIYRL